MSNDMRRLIGITESVEPIMEDTDWVALGLGSVMASALMKIIELWAKNRNHEYVAIDGPMIAETFFLPLNVASRIAEYLNSRNRHSRAGEQ